MLHQKYSVQLVLHQIHSAGATQEKDPVCSVCEVRTWYKITLRGSFECNNFADKPPEHHQPPMWGAFMSRLKSICFAGKTSLSRSHTSQLGELKSWRPRRYFCQIGGVDKVCSFLTCFSLLQGLWVQISLAENGALLLPLIGKLGRLVARVIELISCGRDSVTKKTLEEKNWMVLNFYAEKLWQKKNTFEEKHWMVLSFFASQLDYSSHGKTYVIYTFYSL